MVQILDYSAGYPAPIKIKTAGYAAVIRYLRKEGSSSVRPITRAEFDGMTAQGLSVGLVYQHVDQSRTVNGGRSGGQHDAHWALARARETCGEPRAIYFATDRDTSASQWPSCREYYLGVADVLGMSRTGCYGEYDLLEYLFTRGSVTWGWQTYAWSTGHNKAGQSRHPRAHLFQNLATVSVDGIGCDVNDVLKADWGQYNPSQEEDSDMKNLVIGRNPETGEICVGDGLARRHLPTEVAVENLRYWITQRGGNATIEEIADLDVLGSPMAANVAALSDDEASIIKAIKAQSTDPVDVDILAGKLLAVLPDELAKSLGRKLIGEENG